MHHTYLRLFNPNKVKALHPFVKYLPMYFKCYECHFKATFNMMYLDRMVAPAYFPELFGIVRERSGELLPNFDKEIAVNYFLKTTRGFYRFYDDFIFHENIKAQMFVYNVTKKSWGLLCVFRGDNGSIKVIGSQNIFYVPMNTKNTKIPDYLFNALKHIDMEGKFKSRIINDFLSKMNAAENNRTQIRKEVQNISEKNNDKIKLIENVPLSYMTPEQNMSQAKFMVLLSDYLYQLFGKSFRITQTNIHYLNDFHYNEKIKMQVYEDKKDNKKHLVTFHGYDSPTGAPILKNVIQIAVDI